LLNESNLPGATGWNDIGVSDYGLWLSHWQYRIVPTGWSDPGISHTSAVGEALNFSATIGYSQTKSVSIGATFGSGKTSLTVGVSASQTGSGSKTIPLQWEAIDDHSVKGTVLIAYVRIESRYRTRSSGDLIDNPWSEWSEPIVEGNGLWITMTGERYNEI